MSILLYIIACSLISFFEFLSGKYFEGDPILLSSTWMCVVCGFISAGLAALLAIWVHPPLIAMIALLGIAYFAFSQGAKYSLKKRFQK